MKITFLGTGDFYGNPRYGDLWHNGVDENNSKNTRLRYSILLDDIENQLLIDCSPDFRQQSIIHKIKNFSDVFYTHYHRDHIGGTFELEKYSKINKKHINLWADSETLRELNMNFSWTLKDKEKFSLNEIHPFEEHKIANMNIIPLKFTHGTLNTYGMKYKNTVISADAGTIPEENYPYLENLDLWIMECENIEPTHVGTHFHLDLALEMINKFKPKMAIFTHFGWEWDYEIMNKKLPKGIEMAYDGMIVEV